MVEPDAILDTNAVIALNRQDEELGRLLKRLACPAVTLFTLGELYFGAAKSRQVDANWKRVAEISEIFEVILPSTATAECFGRAALALKAIGRPIPNSDLWIAALCVEHGLPIITRDHHFDHVPGLRVQGW